MSKNASAVSLVIEWSPRRITAYEVASGQLKTFTDPAAMPYAGREALLAISRRSIFVRAARVPNAAPEDIRMVVQMKLAELFPVPPSDLAFDFLLMSDLNEDGRLALIVAMPVTELRKAHEQMASVGIKVKRVIPVAIGATFLAESLNYKDAAIVERSDELASVDLVVDGLLRYSRVVPPGAPIEVEVSRTFNVAGIPCSHIIAAGGAEVGEADAKTASTALEALGGAWLDRLKLNLHLPEVIAARELREQRHRQQFAALMLFIALGLGAYAGNYWVKTHAAVDAVQRTYNLQLTKLTAAQSTADAEATRQEGMQKVLGQAFQPAQWMGDMVVDTVNEAPAGVWLTGVNVERGKTMTARGTAISSETVNQYVEKLTENRRFRSVKLVFENNAEIEKQPVEEFSLSAFPIGNLPIALQQKAGVAGD